MYLNLCKLKQKLDFGWTGRKIKEALFINAPNLMKEVHQKKILTLEEGVPLDPVWAEFNETFREIMLTKMEE